MKSFEFHKKQYSGKPPSLLDAKKMGISESAIVRVKQLEDLRGHVPYMVIAEAVKTANFQQDGFREQILKKKQKYVMNLGVYKQLWYDPYRHMKILKPAQNKFSRIYRPYEGQNLDGKTVLVTRTGGIGDLLFIQPNLVHLKEKYPTCKIWFACGPQYHPMVQTWDCIDRLLELPFTFQRLISANYHAIFEGVIERCEEAHKENAYHLFSRWLKLNLPDEKLIPHQVAKETLVETCKDYLHNKGIDSFIILQMKASSPIRTPRPQFWKNLIEKIIEKGHTIIITDSPAMEEQIDDFITSEESWKGKVFNFAGTSKTLDWSIAMTSLAKCSVSTDSSLIHIAASLGIPAFGLYGPFPGKVRLTTYTNVDWIEPNLECSPCFLHGSSPCRQSIDGHSTCYDKLNLDECVKKIEGLM
ncbi:glycosyltransferase family 9 protein [Candidatus Pacearchaeota archaeon]|nr:glycosyltransferase family 9 protein [Candidatus Pacearchaeota archaeon]